MKPIFLHAHERPVTWVTLNRDGDLLLTCGKDNSLHLWNAKTGDHIGNYDMGNGVVWNCDITLDSKYVAAASADMKIGVFDALNGKSILKIQMPGPCRFVEWCRNPLQQDKIVTIHDDFAKESRGIRITFIDLKDETFDILWEQNNYVSKAVRVHWGAYDQTIISAHIDGHFIVWNAETGQMIREIQAHDGIINCASFDESRGLMMTCSSDKTAKLWRMDKYQCIRTIKSDRPLNACGISPLLHQTGPKKRCHIAVGGGQAEEFVTTTASAQGKFETVLYNIIHCEEVGQCAGHFGTLHTFCWFPDGTGFVSGGADGYVRIYHFDDDYFSEKYE